MSQRDLVWLSIQRKLLRIYYSHANNLQAKTNQSEKSEVYPERNNSAWMSPWTMKQSDNDENKTQTILLLWIIIVRQNAYCTHRTDDVVCTYNNFPKNCIRNTNNNHVSNLVSERHLLHYYHLNECHKLLAMLNTFKRIFRSEVI